MESQNENQEKNENNEIQSDIKIKEEENNPQIEQEEEEINKEDIKDIVDYLSNLDYEKYSRDMEIKEALMVLKTKMDKIQEENIKEKEMQDKKVKIIEDKNATIFNNKEESENKEKKEENTLSVSNRNQNENENLNNIIKNEEIKEPKEIIDEEEVKKKEKIEKYKLAEKIAKSSALKDVHSVQSVQKLLLRENSDEQAPLRITIIKENPLASCDGYIPNKLPFLIYKSRNNFENLLFCLI